MMIAFLNLGCGLWGPPALEPRVPLPPVDCAVECCPALGPPPEHQKLCKEPSPPVNHLSLNLPIRKQE